ncbi:MAG: hypothetical protein HQL71_05490 [Magnetococcales bacterium]|nr:hypothetical protein [Magnetococcales bacterium]
MNEMVQQIVQELSAKGKKEFTNKIIRKQFLRGYEVVHKIGLVSGVYFVFRRFF